MQAGGIGPSLVRLWSVPSSDLIGEVFTPGRVIESEVVSVFGARAILAFGKGLRLEVELQAPLQPGQRVSLQVQPRAATETSSASSILLKVVDTPPLTQPVAPGQEYNSVVWLPIPLPNGGQGWAQIHVDEEAARRTPKGDSGPVHQVRLWWETPSLGAVQVSIGASAQYLQALFTVAEADSRPDLEQALPELQRRLGRVGFPDPQLACRAPVAPEQMGPFRPTGASRFDERI